MYVYVYMHMSIYPSPVVDGGVGLNTRTCGQMTYSSIRKEITKLLPEATACHASSSASRNNWLHYIFEESLEVKLPTIWTDEKQRGEESERREE